MNRLDWIEQELADLQARGMRRELRLRQSPHVGGQVQINGQAYLDFGSNDYLGLSADSRLVDAVRRSAGHAGWGAAASPLISGHGVLHQRLIREICEWKGTAAALLFPTGFAANVGCISSLCGAGDVIFSDRKNHASIIDGCRLSGATVVIYEHACAEDLRNRLAESSSTGKRMIVTDSVFSMDGDIAPLQEICQLGREYDAMVMVDEAHATGILGEHGRGACELRQVEAQVDVRVGTLSKALGSMGGFVTGSQALIDWLTNRARTNIFSTAQPEAISAAAIEAISIVRNEPQRRQRVVRLAQEVGQSIRQLGWDVGDGETPILPIRFSQLDQAAQVHDFLLTQGIFVPLIRPPAVPPNEPLLRVSLSSAHHDAQIETLISALADAKQRFLRIDPAS